MKSSIQLINTCLFVLGIFLTNSFSLRAQTFTIGDFTDQNSNNAASRYPTPYGDFFEEMRAQYYYSAADLIAAGVPAGNINSLGFWVEDLNGAGLHDDYSIKMALTNQDSFLNITNPWLSTGAAVFGPINYQPQVGLNTHTLSTPFYWNGTSNLVIEICHGPDNSASGDYKSQNAIVQQTDVGYKVSLTYRANDVPSACNTTSVSSTNQGNRRPRLWLSVCAAPTNPTLNAVTSTTAQLSWTAPASGTPDAYEYAYGSPNFNPTNGSGIQIGSGTSTGTNLSLTNLNGNIVYSFYVRSKCGNGYSTWAGPVQFVTEASCNDQFTDTNAGLLDNYDTSENYVRVFCPDLNGNALKLSFTLFYVGLGDTLSIYNGNSTSAPLFGSFSGFYLLPLSGPGPFTATTSTGCLTVKFKSDTIAGPLEAGWQGLLSCAALPADSCYKVLQLQASAITDHSAQISWTKMFGAPSYTYKLAELPNTLIDSAVTTNSVVNFNVLTPGTHYRFVVRSNCDNGINSHYDTLYFDTPVRCDALANGNSNLINCGDLTQITASGSGVWDVTGCGNGIHTLGKERIFRFLAPQTRNYGFKMNFASNNNSVKYLYKPVSAGCGPEGWTCIGIFNSPLDSASFGKLVAGQEYYLLADPLTTASVFQRFRIVGCGPLNDDGDSAVPLPLNTPCSDNIYSNQNANFSLGEPNPDTVASDGYKGRWTEPAENTVWFKFAAPASGTVTISTNKISINPSGDTQVALYQVGDPSQYNTYVLLESDEDNGAGFNSNFTYSGLEEGATYYIQVDSWDITAEGPFCIEVDDDAVRQTNDACGTYTAVNVKGSDWINVYTSPAISDIGKIVLAINPMNQSLDTVFASIMTFPSVPLSGNNIPYLPAYFRLRSSIPPTGPVGVRLFFYNSELNALKDSADLPLASASDLVVSQYNGVKTDCNQLNNVGPSTLVPGVAAIEMTNSFYLEFVTSVFGEFGAHFGLVPLPLELQSFTGKIAERSNLLEWVTKTEKNVQWHVVERAADAVNWTEIGRVAGQIDSKITRSYSLTDAEPLASTYYRLRSVDLNGMTSVSNTIHLVRPDRQFTITEVLPNPAVDRVTVRFHTPEEEQVLFRVMDLTGRLVLEQNAETQAGMNEVILPIGALSAGMYQILLTSGTEQAVPMRLVKK